MNPTNLRKRIGTNMQLRKSTSKALASLMSISTVSTLAVQYVSQTALAETTNQTAEGYDLTRQATTAPFPVMFDRPSGVNAAALSGAIRSLGTDAELYKSAVKAVPELADGAKMNRLLTDALSSDANTSATARATIVKLINWYNTLGGTKITTQAGAEYTVENLEQPINTIAVGFAKDKSPEASKLVQEKFGSVKTTGDVMKALDSYVPGVSDGFKKAFEDYKAKVNAPNADIAKLSGYGELKPVLDAYEGMYAKGAAEIRKTILNQTNSTEAAVAFFESAVITGRVDNSDGGNTNQNTPEQKDVKTRWVDESGKDLTDPETGKEYKGKKDFNGYTYTHEKTENGVRTHYYSKKKEPKAITSWVDEQGNKLQEDKNGEFPDNDGKSDIKGYTLIETKTEKDSDGNVKVVNKYKKDVIKPDTYWFDEEGNTLKEKAVGQTLPDTDGKSDIDGYKVIKVYTVTEADLADKGKFAGSAFKVGDTINIYKKDAPQVEPEKPKTKVVTKWVEDGTNKQLKDTQDGTHPDNDGKSDVPGYKLVRTVTDEKGNTTNVYKKIPSTEWVEKDTNKVLKEKTEGSFPDNDGKSDIDGYRLVTTTTDKDGNVKNVYEKIKEPTTRWIERGTNKELKETTKGTFPDNDGESDIKGYNIVAVEKDQDGNVTNIYEKAQEPKKVTTVWVEHETGKVLKEKVEGSFPDEDGKSDIDGYQLVRVDKDKDGNVTNVYAEESKLITHWVDENGVRLSDDEVGKEFGKQKEFKDYKLKDTRKSKDGKQMYYVYAPDKKATPAKETPKASTPSKKLPDTGDTAGVGALAGLTAIIAGLFAMGRRKKSE